jgi:hypothetical protein
MSHASVFSAFAHGFRTLSLVVVDLVRLARLAVHSHSALAAENLFLRSQLAMFQDRVPASDHRHKLPAGYRVVKTSVLGGLHHEYRLVKEAA